VAPLPILNFYLVQDATVQVRLILFKRKVFVRTSAFSGDDFHQENNRS
jgi:hypothetical protein